VVVNFFSTPEEARDTQDWLIHKYHPVENKICPVCGRIRAQEMARQRRVKQHSENLWNEIFPKIRHPLAWDKESGLVKFTG